MDQHRSSVPENQKPYRSSSKSNLTAKNNSKNRAIFQDILKEYIDGNTENASFLIKSAIDDGKLLESDVTRDPILNALVASV